MDLAAVLRRVRNRRWVGLGLAALLVAAAVVLRLTTPTTLIYVTFYPAIILATVAGGRLVGLGASLVAPFATLWAFVSPERSIRASYRWYDRYRTGGPEALEGRSPRPGKVWNRIPDVIRDKVVTLALDEPDLSPRELAVRFTDTEKYFVLETSAYRLLKAHNLITSPAFIVVKAADEFKDKERRIREQSAGLFSRQMHPTSSGRPTSPI